MTFRLRAGVDASTFVEVLTRVQTAYYYHQPGFVRQTFGRDDDTWLILTTWASADAATAAHAARATLRGDVSADMETIAAFIEDSRTQRFVGVD
ncbi:MAG: hypothetical protein AAFY28_18715 [Actinomycetota bacterium]